MQTLKGKRVAFCGRLVNEKRKVVIAKLEMIGGKCSERVCRNTDIFVLPCGFDVSSKPKQLQDAEALKEKGTLDIMAENDFLELLNSCKS